MNTRKIVISSLAALMIVAGNAVAAEQSPFPSSAREVGGHWTGQVGHAGTSSSSIAVFPSAAREFSSLSNEAWPGRDREYHVDTTRMTDSYSVSGHGVAVFPSAAREFSNLYN